MNNSVINKNRVIVLTFFMSALTQAGLVFYTPAFLQISQQLGISSDAVKFTLTVYLLGFGISQLFYGVLSDRFGRKKLAMIGIFIFSIGCFWSMFAHSYTALLISRIVQGIGAGAGMTLTRAIMRDSFTGMDYIKAVTYLSSGFAFGLGFTPVVSGHLLNFFSWRSEFAFLFICSLILLITIWIFLPETYKPDLSKLSLKPFLLKTKLDIIYIVKNKAFHCFLVAGVAAYSVIIAYNIMTPFLFQKALGTSSSVYGWLTFFIATTYYVATCLNRLFLKHFKTQSMMAVGILLIFISGISMLLLKMIAFNIYVVFFPLVIATFGQALVWSISIGTAIKDMSHIAGTAAAFFSFLQMLLSALISAIIAIPSENNQIPLAIVIISLAIISWISFQLGVFKSK